ncbi:MAG: hypothetical protein V4580_14595 [Bacteroidota bacterium]
MAITTRFIPASDAEKGIWLNNFTAKLAVYAVLLGFTPAEITALQKDNAFYQYLIGIIEQLKQSLLTFIGYKNMAKHAKAQQHIGALPTLPSMGTPPAVVVEGIFDRASKLAARAKVSPNYNDNIGTDLGIIAPSASIDAATMQPEIKVNLEVGKPHLKWKKGQSDSLDLHVDRDDGQGFVLVGRFTRNEYLDITPLASGKVFDEWKYKGIYVIADTPVGLFSNVISVDVKKM